MSWNITAVGTKAAIITEVNKQHYIPALLRAAIVETIDSMTTTGVRIESYGHAGVGGNIGKLEVNGVNILLDPVPAPVVESVAAAPAPSGG